MNMRQTFSAVRDLLSNPSRWTKQSYARDVHGAPCGPRADNAACWCLRGAVAKVCEGTTVKPLDVLQRAVPLFTDHKWVTSFNDHSEHAEVLAFLDKVIDLCPADEV